MDLDLSHKKLTAVPDDIYSRNLKKLNLSQNYQI